MNPSTLQAVQSAQVPAAPSPDHKVFVRLFAAFGLCLFATTWKLWTPQTVFPQVPVFAMLIGCPALVHWMAAGGVAIGLVLLLIRGQTNDRVGRIGSCVFSGALVLLFLLDQHRLQPWAWQWLVFAILFLRSNARDTIVWMRWIVVSIYVYSAISKLDYQFANTVGLQMLATIADSVGMSLADHAWLNSNASRIVLLLPLTELLIGLGLAFPRTRFIGGIAAIILHGGLIVVLGPLGMNHRSPVLIWNAFFIVQAYWLFMRPQAQLKVGRALANTNWLYWAFVVGVIAFPATSSLSVCDHWLAWELYAPRSSRVSVSLVTGSEKHLPEHVRRFVKPKREAAWLSVVNLSEWSLQTLNVPVYPQARFQAGVGDGLDRILRQRSGGMGVAAMVRRHRADRWTGARLEEPLTAQADREEFWLNARAAENLGGD